MKINYIELDNREYEDSNPSHVTFFEITKRNGFYNHYNEGVFYYNTEENNNLIKELYPEIYNNLEELQTTYMFDDYVTYSRNSDDCVYFEGIKFECQNCINILQDKIENDNKETISILDKAFNNNTELHEVVCLAINMQIGEVIQNKIDELVSIKKDYVSNPHHDNINWR